MSNLTFVRYTGDGVQTEFPIVVNGENIGYFRTSDIHGYVDDKEVPITIHRSSPHIAIFATPPPDGSVVMVRRRMPITKPYADFERGNNFGKRQVNNSFWQQLYLMQELVDGFLPDGYSIKTDLHMDNHQIKDVVDGTDPQDVVTVHQLDLKIGEAGEIDKKQTAWNIQQDNRLDHIENGLSTGDTPLTLYPWSAPPASGGETQLAPPIGFSSALVSINGVFQDLSRNAFNVHDNKLIFAEPLKAGDEVFALLGRGIDTPVDAQIMAALVRAEAAAHLAESKVTEMDSKLEQIKTELIDTMVGNRIYRNRVYLSTELPTGSPNEGDEWVVYEDL